jgi:hypothetical protein
MFRNQRMLMVAVVAVGMGLATGAARLDAAVVTVQDLLNGTPASVTSGDKLFYNFHGYVSTATGGASVIPASTIGVTPVFDAGQGEYGLVFNSAMFFTGPGQTQDTVFHFDVKALVPPGNLITDATLKMTAAQQGSGRVTIIEDISNLAETSLLAHLAATIQGLPTDNNFSHAVFSQQVPDIHIAKDIGLVGGTGMAALSDFSQTFSQTPEPATIALLGLGGVAAGLVRRRPAR